MPSTAFSYVPSRHTAKSWCSSWPSMWTLKVRYLLGLNSRLELLFRAAARWCRGRCTSCARPAPRRSARSAGAAAARRRGCDTIGAAHSSTALKHCSGERWRFEDVGRVLDLAAAGARQVAAEERLEHQHERVALAAREPLARST